MVTSTLPAGLTFSGPATSSSTAGTTQLFYSADNGTTWTLTPGNAVTTVALLIGGAGDFFAPDASYSLSYRATVPATATAGTTYISNAALAFDNNQDGIADANERRSDSVTAIVQTINAVMVGPQDFSTGNANGSYQDSSNGLGTTYTITRSGDSQSIASVYSGHIVTFTHTIRNDGTTTDTYELSLTLPVPAGISYRFTDMADTTITSLTLAAHSQQDIKLVLDIARDFTSTAPIDLTLLAQGVGSSDVTQDVLGVVVRGYDVKLSNGNAQANVVVSAAPAASAFFPVRVTNSGHNPDSYIFTVNVPNGWTAVVHPAAGDCTTPASGTVSSTGTLEPGAAECYVVEVVSPTGTVANDYPVVVTVTSDTLNSVSDTLTNTVRVTSVGSLTLTPSNNADVPSPGSHTYTHLLSNNTNETATVTLTALISQANGVAPWSYAYSFDDITFTPVTLTGSANALTSLSLAPGAQQTVYLRVTLPDMFSTPGSDADLSLIREVVTLTASASFPRGNSQSASVNDTTNVSRGVMYLTKSARTCTDAACNSVVSANGASAKPGDYIAYTISAKNIGNSAVNTLYIEDTIPAHTDFVSLSAASSAGSVIYSTNGSSWSSAALTGLLTQQMFRVAVDTNSDTTLNASDTVPSGSTLTVTLVVRVK